MFHRQFGGTVAGGVSIYVRRVGLSHARSLMCGVSVIFVYENENGEKRENNEFVNEN